MSIDGHQEVPPSALAPFRYPTFRAIWIANLASNIGSAIQSVAAGWLMTDLTTSHLLIALVQVGATIPILLLGVFAGAIADNFDRRRVMLAAQTLMLAATAALTVTTAMNLISPALLLIFTLAIGCGTALNGPAWQASVRLQVGPRDLPQAIALNSIAFNLARSAGPALGGLMLSATGPAAAFALNTLSYLALIIVLLRWRPESPARQRSPMFSAIADGIRFCGQSAPLRRILLRGFSFGVGAIGIQALLPSLVHDNLVGNELTYGLSLAAFGVGSIFAALWVSRARQWLGSERLVGIAGVIYGAATVPLALTDVPSLFMAAAFLAGTAWVSTLTTLNVAMQLRSPETILGRCMSIYQAVTFGSMALGAWVIGMIADVWSLSAGLLTSGGWICLTAVVLPLVAPMPRSEQDQQQRAAE